MSVIRFPWFVVILILTSLPFYIASAASQASENSIESKTAIEQSIADGNYDFAVKTSLQQKNGYLFELISKAKEKSLASTPTWKILALYKPDYFFGVTSQVDGQEFFLSTQGKTNPEAELNATLAGFFSNKPIGSTTLSPQCRFPARYYWLKQQLGFADERLPEQQCRKFELFKQALNAKTITVVFPSAHPNSPSSMFGHTLLRFDKAGQTNQTRMLAYSDNYAANVDTKNGAIYAIKGLTGGFIGRFSVVPYYIKLREYAQMENRDIWEYRLNLSQQQVDFVVMHAYELAITHFDYFFFTENCSYHLLSLIEVAMPELQLTEQFKGWVIPIDTLKLLDRDHLLSKVTYHPSHATTIKYRRSLLSDAENALALEVFEQGPDSLKEKLNQFPKDRQAAILDLAYDYQRYRKIQDADVLEAKLSQNERRFLLTRAALHVKSQPLNIQTPDTRPDRGHETTRFTLGGGALNHQGYASIGFRAAYHDLLDPTPGYSSHSQLEFFNAKIRYQPKKNRLELDRLTIIDIASLEPRDDFFNNISWKVHAGWQGLPYENDELRTVFTLNGGPGLTYTLGHSQNSFIYGFAQAALNYGNIYNSHYLAGLGITTGLVTDIVPKWKIHLQFNYLKGMTNEKSSTASISLQQGFYLTKDLMFKLDINRQKVLSHFSTDVSGEFRFYF